MANLPTSTNSALRISGLVNLRQGPTYNITTNPYVQVNNYALRGRFKWVPNDRLIVNRELAALRACGIAPAVGNRNICTTQAIHSSSKNYGGSAQLDYDAAAVVLTSITALRKTSSADTGSPIMRADNLPTQINSGASDNSGDLFTQEVRLSSPAKARLEYKVGAFASAQKTTQAPASFGIQLNIAPGIVIPILSDARAHNVLQDGSVAAFGQITFHATDALRLIAGGRCTSAKLSLDRAVVATGARTFTRPFSDKISWKLGAQYDVAPHAMAYATVSRGFKGGQIALPTGAPSAVIQPEVPTSFADGFKTTLFKNWLLELSAFFTQVQDFQAQHCFVSATTGQLVCFGVNVSQVNSRGAKINLFGNVTPNLSVSTSFIVAKTTYPKGFLGNDGNDIGGSQLAYAPRYKFTLSGEYEQPVSIKLTAYLAADLLWKSRIRYEQNVRCYTTFAPAWALVCRIDVKSKDNRFSAASFVRNLGNTHEPAFFLSQGARSRRSQVRNRSVRPVLSRA